MEKSYLLFKLLKEMAYKDTFEKDEEIRKEYDEYIKKEKKGGLMNDIDSIDKKITEVANDNLDALETTLKHIDEIDAVAFSELQDAGKEMLGDCSKDELKKVIELLIKIQRDK